MPIPDLAWTVSALQTPTIAGANATIAELLAGLNAAVVAVGSKWVVSHFSAVNGTLEIKRAGSPTGELATVRILIFGGASPNTAALIPVGSGVSSTTLYGALCIDANTTGPTTAFTAGAPYAGTKYLQGGAIAFSTDIQLASSPRICIIESDDAWGFAITDANTICTYIGGKIIVNAADDALLWASMPSGGGFSTTLAANAICSAPNPIKFAIPTFADGSSADPKPCFYDESAGAVRQFGNTMVPANLTADLGETGEPVALIQLPLAKCIQANSQAETFFGFLRQIRLGPPATHRAQLRDSEDVLVATHIHGGASAGIGMWLDEVGV